MRSKMSPGKFRPSIAIIGVWDPLLLSHEQLFTQLVTTARVRDLTSLVITLYPSPASFYRLPREWPQYNSVATRRAVQRQLGVEATLTMRFAKRDIDADGRLFLERVVQHISLVELWLGAGQTLGRYTQDDVSNFCMTQAIEIRRLAQAPHAPSALNNVRELLMVGRPYEASKIVGQLPIWHKPRSADLILNWPPGEYITQAISHPKGTFMGDPFRTFVTQKGKITYFTWPRADIKWLAFRSGPNDIYT